MIKLSPKTLRIKLDLFVKKTNIYKKISFIYKFFLKQVFFCWVTRVSEVPH